MLSKKTMIPFLSISAVIAGLLFCLVSSQSKTLRPLDISIISLETHSSSQETIQGIKDGLTQNGYEEEVHVHYEISHNSVDLEKLKSFTPAVFITLASPLTNRLKGELKNVPIVYSHVSDPVAAGFIDEDYKAKGNLTGVSGRIDFDAFLDFALKLLPNAQRIGVFFATAGAHFERN